MEAEIILRYDEKFYEIAVKNYRNSMLEVERRNCIVLISDDDIDKHCAINSLIESYSITTIVFCCMCIESMINCYAIKKSSSTYFKNYLDKLDLKSKWVLIPKLYSDSSLNTDTKLFEDLGDLISLRNKLVHDKLKKKRICELLSSDFLSDKDARFALTTINDLIKFLGNIDEDGIPDWLIKDL